ncbi:MAG: prolipoprotein diacylglyceryl transferase [Gammaproteobacteria bacterium]
MQHPHYPEIDPVIMALGPLAVRWYGLAYLAAFTLAWWLGRRRAARPDSGWSAQDVADVIFAGAVGAVLGGRIGYTLFYGFAELVRDPLYLLRIWEGGMSFHGGLIGTLIGLAWFARQTGRAFWSVSDFVAPLVPTGLGLGRLGNFANTELPGRVTDSMFGVVFPCAADAVRSLNPMCMGAWESVARHPSSLYQAVAEGLVLFALVWWFAARPRGTGAISGVFLLGYGSLRIVTETFREPDGHIGFLAMGFTMGQLLSIPMVLIGILLLVRARRARP